ncbi:MAG: desulfoferrodoxin [Prevotella sp.]|nr:desulfoferrodoxin [Prevotella sp.]
MTKLREVYRCSICGNIVEVVNAGGGTLTCCDKPMDLLTENSTDAATEKHVPVVEKIEGGYRVTVGEVEHPMTDGHYIQWIELVTEKEVLRVELLPTDKPVAEFKTDAKEVYAREYCNLHGLWRNK